MFETILKLRHRNGINASRVYLLLKPDRSGKDLFTSCLCVFHSNVTRPYYSIRRRATLSGFPNYIAICNTFFQRYQNTRSSCPRHGSRNNTTILQANKSNHPTLRPVHPHARPTPASRSHPFYKPNISIPVTTTVPSYLPAPRRNLQHLLISPSQPQTWIPVDMPTIQPTFLLYLPTPAPLNPQRPHDPQTRPQESHHLNNYTQNFHTTTPFSFSGLSLLNSTFLLPLPESAPYPLMGIP
jgi:hypothetical protein